MITYPCHLVRMVHRMFGFAYFAVWVLGQQVECQAYYFPLMHCIKLNLFQYKLYCFLPALLVHLLLPFITPLIMFLLNLNVLMYLEYVKSVYNSLRSHG